MNVDAMKRMIDKALGRIRQPFRAVLTAHNTKPPVSLVQGDALNGEQLQDVELFQHFGFASALPKGTQIIVLPLGGKTAHGIIIATEHGEYRLKGLAEGEVAIYDDQGKGVHLRRAGIVVKGAGKTVTITDTPKVRMECDLDVMGQIKDLCDTSTGKTMSDMRDTYNDHDHDENDSGGPTNGPNQEM